MCGIFGVIAKRGRVERELVEVALSTIQHRGPDDTGCEAVQVGDWEVWLGHQRLSIVDLSSAGHQPLWVDHAGKRGAIVYNGEVYNHRELRAGLATEPTSGTDTEVLLRGLLESGPKFLERANGMFAFASLNVTDRELLIGRDRIGKKPLYIYESRDLIAFASELKPIEALGVPLTPSPEALTLYRWLGYVPAEHSAYREVSKFPASSWARIDLSSDRQELGPPSLFWNPLTGHARRWTHSYDAAIDRFLELLDDATALRLEADVPVGAFLSGGIDSSLVASSMAALGSDATAYTIKPDDPAIDESDVARETARALGIDFEMLHLEQGDYDAQFERVPFHYDEPFADFSAIPTLAVSEAARRHVKVVLTGDGGDEMFLGYPWLEYPEQLWRLRDLVPGRSARKLASNIIRRPLGVAVTRHLSSLAGLNPDTAETKSQILADLMAATEPAAMYDSFKCMIQRRDLSASDRDRLNDESLLERAHDWYPEYGWGAVDERELVEQLGALDMVTFMRDDVLVKVDRATMAFGLEARSPLLDYRIVEFAQSLPTDFKIRDGRHKALLRDALRRRLDTGLSERGKLGFGAPFPDDDVLQLPDASTPSARWSRWAEQQWRRRNDVPDPRRLAFLIHDLGGGGAERVVAMLSQQFAQADDVHVVLAQDDVVYEHGGERDILDVQLNEGSHTERLRDLARAVARTSELRSRIDPEAVASFMFWSNIVNLMSRGPGRRVISVRTTLSAELLGPGPARTFYRQMVRKLYPTADAIVTLSKNVGADLSEHFGIPASLVHPIHNPIDGEAVMSAAAEAFPTQLEPFFDGVDVIIGVGRFVPEKGFEGLIRAFAQYRRRGGSARLLLMGGGPLRSRLVDVATSLDLALADLPGDAGDVGLLDFQANPFPIIARSTLFALSSVQEGFGNVILEAMACGVPVLAADCRSGPREILAPDTDYRRQTDQLDRADFGVLMPPFDRDALDDPERVGQWADALAAMLDAPADRDRLVEAGRRRIADFSIEKTHRRWSDVLFD